jgi:hypothetical protein
MSDLLSGDALLTYGLPALLLVAIVALILYRRKRPVEINLKGVLADIAFERTEALVLPNGDDGEIQIDHLLLTANGLVIIDIKDVNGTVFGSDKMQDWSVLGEKGRFTIPNPQPALFDRIAAVRHIVRQVPVSGRVLFLEGAQFSKGTPGMVCNLSQLQTEFGESDKAAAKFKIDAFRQHWEALHARAITGGD